MKKWTKENTDILFGLLMIVAIIIIFLMSLEDLIPKIGPEDFFGKP